VTEIAPRLIAPPDAADAAAFWLVKRDRGVSVESDPGFTAWLAASEAHAAAWRRATAAWETCEAGDDPLLEAMRRDALSARRPSARYAPWLAAAACAAIAVAGATLGWRSFIGAPPAQLVAANAPPTLVTAVGAPRDLALQDGSRVTLDTDSALAVAYVGDHRAVRLLRGQASFNVIHDPSRPFTVDVGARTVTDLGTEFVVGMDGPSSLHVTLVTGRISVSAAPGAPAWTLAPGQELEAGPGRADQIVSVDLARSLAWRDGYLEFQGEPLNRAIAEMNRYGGAPVAVADASLGGLPVSGRFRVGNPVRFAEALSEVYPLRLTQRPGGGAQITRR
jgi:transmembrane sensor